MGRRRKLTPEQENEVIEWWLSARTAKAKARELGISPTVIYNTLCERGVMGYRNRKQRKQREHERDLEILGVST